MYIALIECQDCLRFICTNCRESHLRDSFYNVSSSVDQLRREIPKVSEKLGSYQQRVANVQTNFEQIRQEITSTVTNMINELKHREAILLNEAEIYRQSQLRFIKRKLQIFVIVDVRLLCFFFIEIIVFNKKQYTSN